jgi:hypothetical protein
MVANPVLVTKEIREVKRAQYFRNQSLQHLNMTAAVLTLLKLHR